jgi:hypothetical protein
MPAGFYRSFQLILFICVTLIHFLSGLGICLLCSSFFLWIRTQVACVLPTHTYNPLIKLLFLHVSCVLRLHTSVTEHFPTFTLLFVLLLLPFLLLIQGSFKQKPEELHKVIYCKKGYSTMTIISVVPTTFCNNF